MKGQIRLLACIIGALSLLAGSQARAEYEEIFTTSTWQGYALYDDDSGAFRHCGAAQEDGSSLVIFAIMDDLTLAILLRDTGWELGTGRDYTVTMQVDSRRERTVTGVSGEDLITFNLGFDYDFLDDLRGGYTLYVRGARTLEYSLKGTSYALAQVARCALARAETEEDRNPFGSSPGNPFGEGSDDGLTEDEVDNLRVVLNSAGLENVQIQSGPAVQERMGENTLAAWTAGSNVIGFYYLEDYDGTTEPRVLMSYLMAELGSACEGQLATAQDEPVQTSVDILMRGSAACLEAQENFYYDAFVIIGSTYVIMIAHISDETSHAQVVTVTKELVNMFRD